MADIFSKKTRSYNMSQIRSVNTKPEQSVRSFLFSNGFRYRKNVSTLPGKPDIVLPKYNTVIFVNGCFWHLHNCPSSSIPQSNQEFWIPKLTGNKKRDERNISALKDLGWHVIVIWECELKKKVRDERLNLLLQELNSNFYEDLNNRLNNL
ncbi:DNA mismatch endonuclease Vsr [Methanimicrococcus sp. OttesenSCG-928-J09]|nr:DNA mismatch endonuclease Vsr [Methanimicrococcus sp. OttesenSCG-928-J09]